MPRRFPGPPGARRSIALVTTLAILALVSTLLIGFVAATRQDRGASQGYGDSLRADQLALGGLDEVVAALRAEIADPSRSTAWTSNGYSLYLPADPTDIPPRSTVTNSVYPLIQISGGATGLAGAVPQADLPASDAPSTSPSLNSRRVTLDRWNKPLLVPLAATNLFPAPKWIVVGRQGPFAPAAATPAVLGCGPGLSSANEVLGRFAYAVYDLGGLLDINVAGHPGIAGGKGLMPWADLSQILHADGLIAFPALRNAGTAAAFGAYVTNWAAGGFLTVAAGDTAFLSRQELIRYATDNGFAAALPGLTVFTRDLNGPTWSPAQPSGSSVPYTNAAAFAGTAGATNFFLPSVRVTGGGFVRANGLPAVAGEPLVRYRFPLDKLALLQTGTDTAAILKYFGLTPDATPGSCKKWIYTSPTGTSALSAIKTLDKIAGREPDFFELLKATILSGSLGKAGRGDEFAGNPSDPDSSPDGQIIQIGANIIDQAGSDNLPSTVVFNNLEFYGVKDLPYLSQVFATCIPGSPPQTSPARACFFFNLWNPHQPAATAIPRLRLIPLDGNGNNYSLQYAVSPSDVWTTPTQTGKLNAGSPSIVLAPAPADYRSPTLLTVGTLGGNAVTLAGNSACAFPISVSPPSGSASSSHGTAWNAVANDPAKWSLLLKGTNNGLSFALQYEYPPGSGAYHTYNVFAGKIQNSTSAAIGGLKFGTAVPGLLLSSTADTPSGLANSSYFTKADPRTARWAASWDAAPYGGATSLSPTGLLPFGKSAPYDIGQWCTNAGAGAYADPDGIVRPGDNARGASPYASPAASPAFGDGRPLVLERPFASVGELGYVFRDLPWKTLDFSSTNSADAGLLDLFTVTGGLARRTVNGTRWTAAGRLNPDGAGVPALAALLSGAQKNASSFLTSSDAATLAAALTNLTATTPCPLTNRANLADRFLGGQAVPAATAKTEREAVVRALAESANTRTWNLLVDLVAQTGHYPADAATFDDFVVTGERRYWLHVALDRYTGEVVDQQIEAVSE